MLGSTEVKICRRHVVRVRRPGLYRIGGDGLHLCVGQDGSRTWVLPTTIGGAFPQQIELGNASEVSQENARRRLRDVARLGSCLYEPVREPKSSLTRREVQQLSGKEYGRLVLEAYQRECIHPGSVLQKEARESLERELLQAFYDGEIANVHGTFRFKGRGTRQDPRRNLQIAKRIEWELIRGARSINEAVEKAGISRDDSAVKKTHRQNKEAAAFSCRLEVAQKVEAARVTGVTFDQAVQKIARELGLPADKVRSFHSKINEILSAEGLRALLDGSAGAN